MKLPVSAFTPIALADLAPKPEAGKTGRSFSRTFERGGVRPRLVEYGPGYLADHWCDRGHVFHFIVGEVTGELNDGRASALRAGERFVVSDFGDAAHRVRAHGGGTAFIAD
jgi:hypothetical protein